MALRFFIKIQALLTLLFLTACATPPALPPGAPVRYVSTPVECVPYARAVSGIEIRGNAYSWWNAAPHYGYARGNMPRRGAVLVLARTRAMPGGHVATVSGILDYRHITVNHSNWGDTRGRRKVIYRAMPAEDISTHNDWTLVRFWNYELGVYGLPYTAKGFIYQKP